MPTITLQNACRLPCSADIIVCAANLAHRDPVPTTVWKSFSGLGTGSSACFTWGEQMLIRASWAQGQCRTACLPAQPGMTYTMLRDPSGAILRASGPCAHPADICLKSDFENPEGICGELVMDGAPLLRSRPIGLLQQCYFLPDTKLYFGLAVHAHSGESLRQVRLISQSFYELEMNTSSPISLTLSGDLQRGYTFQSSSAFPNH